MHVVTAEPGRNQALAPIGTMVFNALLNKFGRAPMVTDFFTIYSELRDVYEDLIQPDPELYTRVRRSASIINTRLENDATRDLLDSKLAEVLPLIRRLSEDTGSGERSPLPDSLWRRLVEGYADMIQTVAADRGVYLATARLPGIKPVRWLRLQKASADQEEVERLRREDPDLFLRMMESKAQRQAIAEAIKQRIVADGLQPSVRNIMGRPMNVGLSEDSPDEYVVYDDDGQVLTPAEFVSKVRAKSQSQKNQLNINLTPAGGNPLKDVAHLRSYTDAQIAEALADGATVEYISLTDDPDSDTAITRVYPVISIDNDRVVSDGRFKGLRTSDLVNAAGRQIEGSAYYIDPATGRIGRRDVKKDDGSGREVRQQREPYVTVDDGRLYLRVYEGQAYTAARQRLKKISESLPSIEYVANSRGAAYRFAPKDFATVREVLGGMALSSSAARMLRSYFEELSRAEQAANAANLTRYSQEALNLRLPLRSQTKRALAWMDANENQGVCALDTGMGKTVTAIAATLNLIRKGEAEVGPGNNGRFLYVCETALLGNLPKEVFKFVKPEEAQAVLDRIDVESYPRFIKAWKADPTFGDDYVAIFFDEAHNHLKKKTQAAYKAAVQSRCKRKVLMTASAMVKTPLEAVMMASVSLGIDVNTPEGAAWARKLMSRWTESVGGRVVGVTSDPIAARDFRIWVKKNIFYADKRDVGEEDALVKDLRQETVAVVMPAAVEEPYRRALAEVMPLLRELVGLKYNPADPRSFPLAAEEVARRISRPLRLLTKLSDTPDRVIPGLPNPKLDQAAKLASMALSDRILIFGEDKDLALDCYERMKKQFPGRGHVLGQTGFILYCSPTGEEYKYGERIYVDPETGRKTEADEWKTFVLTKVLGLGLGRTDKDVHTCTLTGSYAVGQNLQSFGTVLHLDRDDWSSETMKQRTARAWRAGNQQPVDEYTLDLVFPESDGGIAAELTLDEMRRVIQQIDANLFDRVIVDAQVERLGEEWLSIKKQRSSLHHVSRKMIERALSPYATQLGALEGA